MRGKVDKDACIGCGLCAAICEEIFIMDDDGKAVAKDIDIDPNNIPGAKDAEAQCPVSAIVIEE